MTAGARGAPFCGSRRWCMNRRRPPLLASARDPDESWRSRGRRHGRTEVEPSQPQVQDEVQNPELEGVRAWPQEPRRRHDLVIRPSRPRRRGLQHEEERPISIRTISAPAPPKPALPAQVFGPRSRCVFSGLDGLVWARLAQESRLKTPGASGEGWAGRWRDDLRVFHRGSGSYWIYILLWNSEEDTEGPGNRLK